MYLWKYYLWYYLGINILLFSMMGLDKLAAVRQKRRTKEKTLFILALLGGAAGGLAGMGIFRHKIRKPIFYGVYIASLVFHFMLEIYIYFLMD